MNFVEEMTANNPAATKNSRTEKLTQKSRPENER